MRTVLKRPLALLLPAVLFTLAASAVAVATLQQPADFAPFTMTKDAWNAQLSSSGAGTEQFRIEYRSRNSWTVTLLSHSENPAMNGTSWKYEGGSFTFFDAWRKLTRSNRGDVTVDQWIEPGLFRSLASQSGWSRTNRADRTTELRRLDTPAVQGQVETSLVFDTATELPVNVAVRVEGKLVQQITYRLSP